MRQIPAATVRLVPADQSHLAYHYGLATADPQSWRWRFRNVVPEMGEFSRGFFADVQLAYTCCVGKDPVGFTCLYGLNLRDGYAYAATQMQSSAARGLGVEATLGLCGAAFERWPIRKIYFEVPRYNLAQFASACRRLLDEEGCLREHIYYDGQYHDMLILAVTPARLAAWTTPRPETTDGSFGDWLGGLVNDGLVDVRMNAQGVEVLVLDSVGIVGVHSALCEVAKRELAIECVQSLISVLDLALLYQDVASIEQ